jgi:hypothetical protein
MGINDVVGRWKDSRNRRQLERTRRVLGPSLQAAEQARWRSMVSMLPPAIYQFVEVKWRLPSWFEGGNPPRPRSAQEVADMTGDPVGGIRLIDWDTIDYFRASRRGNFLVPSFLTVPIDEAQAWWDRQHSWLLYPNGSRKPEGEQGPAPSLPPDAPDWHEVEDRDELRRHLLEVHQLEWVRDDPVAPTRGDHVLAHEHEAQDREWDQRLRPHEAPGP